MKGPLEPNPVEEVKDPGTSCVKQGVAEVRRREARRKAMSQTANAHTSPGEDQLLSEYLALRTQSGAGAGQARSAEQRIRTCPSCGRRVVFYLEPEGGWARCSFCGRYA